MFEVEIIFMAQKRSVRDLLVFDALRVRKVCSALLSVRSRLIKLLVLAIVFGSLTFLFPQAQTLPISPSPLSSNLPSPKIHPLPQSLAQWQTKDDFGDYFSQIQTTAVGYLVWSKFPLKIYLEQPNSLDNSASNLRFQQWVIAIREAIKEWNNYLPLVEIEDPELADIIITRSQVDREIQLDPVSGLYKIPRAITAQATYEFYLNSDSPPLLCHRMKVQISPDLGKNATL